MEYEQIKKRVSLLNRKHHINGAILQIKNKSKDPPWFRVLSGELVKEFRNAAIDELVSEYEMIGGKIEKMNEKKAKKNHQ